MEVENQYDLIMRWNQVDLAELDRERLEEIMHGLLQGHASIFYALAAETRQHEVIKQQKTIIDGMQSQIVQLQELLASTNEMIANMASGDPTSVYYRDTLLSMAEMCAGRWSIDNKPPTEEIVTGIWRAVEQAGIEGHIDINGSLYGFWSALAEHNFGFGDQDDDSEAPEDHDSGV